MGSKAVKQMGGTSIKPLTALNGNDYAQQSAKVMKGNDVISRKNLLSQLLGDFKLTREQKERIKTVEYLDGQKGFSYKEVQAMFSMLNAGKWNGMNYWEVDTDLDGKTDTEEKAYSYKQNYGTAGYIYKHAIDSFSDEDIHNLYTQF